MMNLLYAAALIYTVSVYGTMATMSIAAGLVFAAWLFGRRGHYREDFELMRRSAVFWPTVALGLACLWSLAWAKYSGLEFMGMRPTVTWDDTRKAWHLVFPFVLFAVLATLDDPKLHRLVKVWLAAGVASAVLGLVQHYVPIYDPTPLPYLLAQGGAPRTTEEGLLSFLHGRYHATGLAGFHLSYSAIMAFPACVALALTAVLYRREGATLRTARALGVFVLFFAANVLTYSKIAWLALPAAAVVIALLGFKGRARYALVGAITVACVAWIASPEVRQTFSNNRFRAIEERKIVWGANLEMIRQFPMFGVGWHRNSELSHAYYEHHQGDIAVGFESHAHNNLLDQLATTGVVGLTAFLWLNGVLFLLAWQLYQRSHGLLLRTLGLGLVGGWVCLHLNGITQVNWWDAKVLHQIGWVTAISLETMRRMGGKPFNRTSVSKQA